jgi:hypothetical protein
MLEKLVEITLKTISIPNICIGSYGMNMHKLKIQLYLNKQFKNKDYKVKSISFNPIAHIFDYCFLNYPKNNTSYYEYFYFLNNRMHKESF